MISGEPYDSRPFRQRDGRAGPFPARPLWGDTDQPRGWGAWELAARYSNGDIARELSDLGYVDFSEASQEFRSMVGALNWFPSEDLRFTLQVVRTIADQFPQSFGNQGRDTSWVFRTQWTF
jgi:phosphate-selective porin